MGQPLPEDGQPLPFWKARRFIRNVVWLVGGLLLVYLLGLDLSQSRENKQLVADLHTQQTDFEERVVKSLAGLLAQVIAGEEAAAARDVAPKVTFDKAVEVLKETFPAAIVDRAVQRATAPGNTTTTSRATTSTTLASTTSTTAQGPPGPPGPPGPQGPPGRDAESPTTTTTRPTLCVPLLPILAVGC